MRLFFLHIEKCAGTSLQFAMNKAMEPHLEHPSAVTYMDGKASWTFAKGHDLDPWTYRDQLLAYHLASKHGQYVTGHFRYNIDLHRSYAKQWTCTVVLRDPVDRFLSHFYYNRHKKETHGQIDQSLEAYIETKGALHAAVLFVTMLAARPRHYSTVTESDIEQACRNLEDFELIGVLEDLPDYCARFKARMGEPLDIPKLNSSPAARKRHESIPEDLMVRIRDLCEPSTRVYQAALALIETRREAGDQAP